RVHGGQRVNGTLGRRTTARADGRRTFRLAAPATLQFVQRGVELSPLTTREKPPFQRVLQTLIIFAVAAPGDLGARAANIQSVQNGVVPRAVIGTLANQRVELAPVVARDGLTPMIKVSE